MDGEIQAGLIRPPHEKDEKDTEEFPVHYSTHAARAFPAAGSAFKILLSRVRFTQLHL
jgi:hypothetical protein